MLTPSYLAKVAEGAEEIASTLHSYIINQIIERMMIRIGKGEEYIFTSSDRWRIQLLQDAGYLLENITKELALYTKKQEKEIKAAMKEAGIKTIKTDNAVYEAAGLSALSFDKSPELIRLAERNYQATLGEWKNYTRTTALESQKLFIEECDNAYILTTSGAASYPQAVMQAVDNIATKGVTVNYKGGRKEHIETAVARAVRTGIAQASGDVSLKRMEEMEWDIILVSAHIGARSGDGGANPGNHLWWQGNFYSRTGKDKRFPPFELTGYGTGEGLCGWNCRHSFGSGDGVHNPYKHIQTAENAKIEKLEQRQRKMERNIRKSKREIMAMQKAVEKCEDEQAKFELQLTLDKKSYILKKQNESYNSFCKENNLRSAEERRMIAKWGREQASKSIADARRYEDSIKE